MFHGFVRSPLPKKFGENFFQKKLSMGDGGDKCMKAGENLKAIQWYNDGDLES